MPDVMTASLAERAYPFFLGAALNALVRLMRSVAVFL